MWLKSVPTCFDIHLGDGARRRVSPYNDLLELPDLTKILLVVAYRFENLQSLRARFVATCGTGPYLSLSTLSIWLLLAEGDLHTDHLSALPLSDNGGHVAPREVPESIHRH